MPSVIVVGSGVAGLTAALTASATHEVTLVTKAAIAESNTRYAQGGIAVAIFSDDSAEAHIADTLRVGAGLNNLDAVHALCSEGPDRVRELIQRGVEFDREGGELAHGLEAAHSYARVLHAGGDATGARIEAALVRAVLDSSTRVVEDAFVTDLIVSDGRVVGVEVLTEHGGAQQKGLRERLTADAVILASGGAGQLYRHTTNPVITTGDGLAAAWRAGAELVDLEFYQFHPTALAVPGNFLVSEAVRGDGAVLRNAAGERFMLDVHPDAELAPRDVVARGIAIEMAAQDGKPVYLDATGLGAEFLASRFPTIDAACRRFGYDWATQPVPVTPAAHYWMGGVATDSWGRTTLPGLYAVGEVACTGVHGANRLASNSLLESVVFAYRAARSLADSMRTDAMRMDAVRADSMTTDAVRPDAVRPGSLRTDAVRAVDPVSPKTAGDDAVRVDAGPRGDEGHVVDRGTLQQLMWDYAGIHRLGAGLGLAAETLAGWRSAEPASATVAQLEDANLLQLGRLIVAAALERRESRGAHYRSDYPTESGDFARHLTQSREVSIPC